MKYKRFRLAIAYITLKVLGFLTAYMMQTELEEKSDHTGRYSYVIIRPPEDTKKFMS